MKTIMENDEAYFKDIVNEYLEMYERIDSNETLVIILKAHLYIESEINEMLKNIDPLHHNPRSFYQSLLALNSTGSISDIKPVLQLLNKIRNNYAHERAYSFQEKDYTELFLSLPAQLQTELLHIIERDCPDTRNLKCKLKMLLSLLWYDLACRGYKHVQKKLSSTKQ